MADRRFLGDFSPPSLEMGGSSFAFLFFIHRFRFNNSISWGTLHILGPAFSEHISVLGSSLLIAGLGSVGSLGCSE
jgi:hypothetical protein